MLGVLLATSAHALTLGAVSPLTVGVTNSVTATGATPGGQVTFAYGLAAGNTPVPGCAGLSIAIANPVIVGTVVASYSLSVPRSLLAMLPTRLVEMASTLRWP